MKIDIIRYNRFHKITRYLFYIIGLIMIVAFINNKFIQLDNPILRWCVMIIAGVWIILSLILEPFNRVGKISLFKDGHAFIIVNDQRKSVQIESLAVYYGGYKGEMHELEIFYTGSFSRDGTQNFLFIYGEKYQVFLSGLADLTSLKLIINELHSSGIGAEFITKKNYTMKSPEALLY